MSDLRTIADRVEIDALRAEFSDAVLTRDFDRLASLFTEHDGTVRMPHIDVVFTGREQIRAGVARLQALWDVFVQHSHPGALQIDGDTASGRTYMTEQMHGRPGSNRNYGIYHDRYRRTPEGWRFAERVYEARWVDPAPPAG